MTGGLGGKRVLVVGGGTGIGLASAAAMLADGASVLLNGRRAAVLAEAAAGLGAPGRVFTLAGDATDAATVEALVADAIARMGGLDCVVIAAGVSGRTGIADADPGEVRRILDQNVMPVFLACRYAAPHLIAQRSGALIAISSMYGLVGQRERVAYSGAKAAVIGMIRAMALDLAPYGVRANAICPGFVETDLSRRTAAAEPDPEAALAARRAMHPIPRAGQPEEIGAMAAFLASDAAGFITGQALSVDGGYTAR
jgi:NAD(P)-dependent dehydrogenase (short-subunit alcohol dehydrogenase family)